MEDNIEEEALAFCNGWSKNFYDGRPISRGEVTAILVNKKEKAIPIIKKIFDLNFKNKWGIPYIKSDPLILDGGIVAIINLEELNESLKYILSEYEDHTYVENYRCILMNRKSTRI